MTLKENEKGCEMRSGEIMLVMAGLSVIVTTSYDPLLFERGCEKTSGEVMTGIQEGERRSPAKNFGVL